jgi:hypothetical protein
LKTGGHEGNEHRVGEKEVRKDQKAKSEMEEQKVNE